MKFETEVRIKFESAFRLNWSFVHIETMSFFPRQFLTYKFVMESMRLVFHGSFFMLFRNSQPQNVFEQSLIWFDLRLNSNK